MSLDVLGLADKKKIKIRQISEFELISLIKIYVLYVGI